MIRVLIIDDHAAVRGELAACLAEDPAFAIVATLAGVDEALRCLAMARPHVVLVDHGPPLLDGIQACSTLLRRRSNLRVIVMTSAPRQAVALAAFDAGAAGVVVKGGPPALLRSAVRSVAAGGTSIDPSVAGPLVRLAIAAGIATSASAVASESEVPGVVP